MDDIQKPNGFQVREIKQEQIPVSTTPPEKKPGGLISLFSKKNLLKTITIIVIIAILIAGTAILWGRQSFSRAKVEIDIEVPEDIASGQEIILTVKYKNNNRVNLNDAKLVINYPPDTFSSKGEEIYQEQRSLGIIPARSERKQDFKLRLVGEKGADKNLLIKLIYQPQNINSRFENSSSFGIKINSLLVGVSIEGSEKTITGQEVHYSVEYENKSDKDISDLKIELAYSDDFEFKEADPNPEEIEGNNTWQIDLLKSGEKQTIELKGTLKGEEGESKILKATISKMEDNVFFQYSYSEFVTQITPSPLVLFLEIEKFEEKCNLSPGQKLNYKIKFKNNTDVALRELVLKAYFQDNIFDFKTLDLGGVGFFDSRENVITWSGAEISALNLLEINQSDQVSFSVKIKASLPIFTYNDKNFQAKVLAEIETLTVPAKFSVSELKVEKEFVCKINTQLDLQTKVYYYEPKVDIINTGPIPPKVDELTTYTVHWQITNTSNDLENVQVKATLPQGIIWSDHYINKVSNSNFYYNERTKEVVWEISRVPAGIGVVLPVYELVFQIGLRPSINQVYQTPILINESFIEAKDIFTEITLEDSTSRINTSLPDDLEISFGKGRVQE